MKQLLVIFMFLCSTSCFAQDVIVKKDGSTILSKVIEIGSTEIKYKKFSNQDGPTYSIYKSEIQTINYENGEKENFSGQTQLRNEFNYLNETSQKEREVSVKNRLAAEDLYREARTLKAWSWVCVVLGTGGGITGLVLCKNETLQYVTLGAGIAVCCIGGGALMGLGQKKKREAELLLSSTLINHDFKVGKYTISPSVNLLSETRTHKTNLGVGVKLYF